MIDLYTIGSQHPGTDPTWTTIDIQGTVKDKPIIPARKLAGLTYKPATRLYYTVAPTNPEGPLLCSISTAGELEILGPTGKNMTGGIAYHGADDCFYALSNESDGSVKLYRITTSGQASELFTIAVGMAVGLTYVQASDTFYALITQDNFTWFYSIKKSSTVTKLFGAGLRVFGGLCHSPSENLFYFVANEEDGFSYLWTLALSGSVVKRMGLGYNFNHAGISMSPWFGGSMNIKSLLEGERFVSGETTLLDANILSATGTSWNSDGIAWKSTIDGALGTGSPTVTLSPGTHVITASKERLKQSVTVRVFADLGALYKTAPSPAEIGRVLEDFTFHWVDGTSGDPTQRWDSYPGFPFDQTSPNPSRTAVIAKLDVLRHQRFSQPLPYGTAATAYEQVRLNTHTIRVSLDTPLNMAGGGVINLNRTFTTWWNNPATPTVAAPYVHSLYLFNHESRHNEPGDPGHATCTAWTGAPAVDNGMDAKFEPGSGFARATLYIMWVYKYARYDPPAIRTEAKDIALQFKDRFCAHPTSSNPLVQALLTELWNA
ncbi:hypothetical protein ACFYQT_40640 [Streptomyces tibetensis]|uniref:Uncharacterized protein n=1 Tax=Streptomyces tibetensis TaxID=2382123 RepID=A0ABW6N8Z2_9ACTN